MRPSIAALSILFAATQSVAAASFIGANFTGGNINQSGFIPPDTMGGIGINSFDQFLNGVWNVYSKTGTQLKSASDANFWPAANVTPNGDLSDPRVVYDQLTGRWFASEIDLPASSSVSNDFLIAVSATSDPLGPWSGFKINADSTNSIFADFPMLGVNAQGVYLASNNFALSGSQSFQNDDVLSIPKSSLLASTPSVANFTLFQRQKATDGVGRNGTPGLGFAVQPVTNFSPTATTESLLAVSDTSFNKLNLTFVQNASTPTASLSSTTAITTNVLTSSPPLAFQPDGTQNLDADDYRIPSMIYQVGNTIYSAHGISSNSRAAIRWEEINATTHAIIQAGTIGDPNFDYTYPSINANANGDVVIGFTRTGQTDFASAYAVVGSTSGGTTTFGTPFLLAHGTGDYHVTGGGTDNRWGDYSSTSLDPADPQIFWTTQEFAQSTNVWATQISEIIIPLAGEARWQSATNGNFFTAGNYFNSTAPTSSSNVIFSRATNSPYTVSFTASASTDRLSARQGTFTLNLNGNSYSLTNSSTTAASITVAEFQSTPNITIANGALNSVNTVIAPGSFSTGTLSLNNVHWNNSGSVYVGGSATAAAGTGSLNFTGISTANITGILKVWPTGSVTAAAGNITAGAITLSGPMSLAVGAPQILRTSSLSIDPTTSLDLGNHAMVLDYATTSPQASIRSYLTSGFANGNWSGNGIRSAAAANDSNHSTAVGYAEASDLGLAHGGAFEGQTIPNQAVLVKYTYYGDENLDGVVNLDDFSIFIDGFNGLGTGWIYGDFNYDGVIDQKDFALFVQGFDLNGQPLSQLTDAINSDRSLSAAQKSAILSVVPEPSCIAFAGLALCPLKRRRRR